MKPLSPEQLTRAAVLLDEIVRPGDHNFGPAIEEAQELLGYSICKPAKKRGRPIGSRNRPKARKETPK